MRLPVCAIAFGVFLNLVAVISYFQSISKSVTAWIPAFIGIPLLLAGLIGLNPIRLKAAMHAAALLALLGFLASAGKLAGGVAKGGFEWTLGTISQTAMAVLCGVFLALCIQSFIAVRKARQLN